MKSRSGRESGRLNRRQFLNKGVMTTAVAMGSAVTASQRAEATPVKQNKKHPYNPRTHQVMPTRNLGKTGYQVGILSLGGQATVERKGMEEEAVAILDRAIELGVNYIDTAASYGGGISQIHIGKVMKKRRHEVYLASKTHDRSYDGSMKLLDQSLKSLQTDHLDCWQLHNIQRKDQMDQIFAKDGAIHALKKAKEEGMVRFLGVTGHYEPLILVEMLKRFEFDTLLLALNAADAHYLSFIKYLLPEAQKQNVGTIGMKVATRGRMLSCWNPPPLEEQPKRMATQLKGTVSIQEALSYNMTLPVSTTIIGYDNVRQVEENIKIASEFSPLTDEEMAALEYKTLPIVRQGLYFRRWDLGV